MGVLPIQWPSEVIFDTSLKKWKIKVDIEWKIPAKETCDIGENTVVSVKNHLCKRALRSRRIQEDRPAWNKYVRVDEDKHIPSVIHRLFKYKKWFPKSLGFYKR